MNIKGKLVKKLDVESGISKSGKEWKKQSVLIEQNEKFNKLVMISFFGDKINSIDKIEENTEVSISVNVYSREYNGKYYTSLDGWHCAKLGEETVGSVDTITAMHNIAKNPTGNNNDDLPF